MVAIVVALALPQASIPRHPEHKTARRLSARPANPAVNKAGVEGLEAGRRVVVPGLPMRAAMLASRYIPHAVKLPVIENVMRRR